MHETESFGGGKDRGVKGQGEGKRWSVCCPHMALPHPEQLSYVNFLFAWWSDARSAKGLTAEVGKPPASGTSGIASASCFQFVSGGVIGVCCGDDITETESKQN